MKPQEHKLIYDFLNNCINRFTSDYTSETQYSQIVADAARNVKTKLKKLKEDK